MPNVKTILKAFIALAVWSVLVLGLFKLHNEHVVHHNSPASSLSSQLSGGRLLLQKDSRYSFEATSTTTDRIPYDVLIDSRAGEWTVVFAKETINKNII